MDQFAQRNRNPLFPALPRPEPVRSGAAFIGLEAGREDWVVLPNEPGEGQRRTTRVDPVKRGLPRKHIFRAAREVLPQICVVTVDILP